MIFSITLPRVPKSVQADKIEKYKQSLRNAAKREFTDAPTGDTPLYVRIIWFARKKGGPDVDNIVKPILDALDGVVYRSDSQIGQCLSTRIDLSKPYTISYGDIADEDYQQLTDLLASNHSDILYIEVGRIYDQKVVFGPIDGGMP